MNYIQREIKRVCKRETKKKKFREKNFYFNGQDRIHPNTMETRGDTIKIPAPSNFSLLLAAAIYF